MERIRFEKIAAADREEHEAELTVYHQHEARHAPMLKSTYFEDFLTAVGTPAEAEPYLIGSDADVQPRVTREDIAAMARKIAAATQAALLVPRRRLTGKQPLPIARSIQPLRSECVANSGVPLRGHLNSMQSGRTRCKAKVGNVQKKHVSRLGGA